MAEGVVPLKQVLLLIGLRALVAGFLAVPFLCFPLDHHFGEHVPAHAHLLRVDDSAQVRVPPHLHLYQVEHAHGVNVPGARSVAPPTRLVRGIAWQTSSAASPGGSFHASAALFPSGTLEAPLGPDVSHPARYFHRHRGLAIAPPDPPPVEA